VLSASPSAYSANPKADLSSPPALIGSSISLVSVVQVYLFNKFEALYDYSN
jgi:oligosaccharyltransferase complex subunit beta